MLDYPYFKVQAIHHDCEAGPVVLRIKWEHFELMNAYIESGKASNALFYFMKRDVKIEPLILAAAKLHRHYEKKVMAANLFPDKWCYRTSWSIPNIYKEEWAKEKVDEMNTKYTVNELSIQTGVQANKIIKFLFNNCSCMATVNQVITVGQMKLIREWMFRSDFSSPTHCIDGRYKSLNLDGV